MSQPLNQPLGRGPGLSVGLQNQLVTQEAHLLQGAGFLANDAFNPLVNAVNNAAGGTFAHIGPGNLQPEELGALGGTGPTADGRYLAAEDAFEFEGEGALVAGQSKRATVRRPI